MMTILTIEELRKWDPCFDIQGIFKGRESLTAKKILKLNIPVLDRLWILLQNNHFFSTKQIFLIAADLAEDILQLFESRLPSDSRPRDAIKSTRRFALGESTLQDLSCAHDNAWLAARDAWNACAIYDRDAPYAAAWAAADAARDITSVAYDTAWVTDRTPVFYRNHAFYRDYNVSQRQLEIVSSYLDR